MTAIKISKTKLLVLFTFLAITSLAQEDILTPVETGLGIFSDITIAKVRLLSQTEESLTIEVQYDINDGKAYSCNGRILSKGKNTFSEIQSTTASINKSKGVFDMRFDLKKSGNKSKYSKPYIDSEYVKLILTEKGEDEDSWGDILKSLGEDNPLEDALGEGFLFKHQMQWRIGGGKGMVIEVPITPIGKSSVIRQ